nr:hypothetical protein [uncultured Rhodopila sp.]
MAAKPSAKLPAIQFYTGDWFKDPGVRSVSLAARGLWIDMLCLMSEATPRGFLSVNENPISNKQLARIVGSSEDEVGILVTELELAGVFSRRNTVIYSRRIVRDEAKRQIDRKNGKKGGSPLLKYGGGPTITGGLTPPEDEVAHEDEETRTGGGAEGDRKFRAAAFPKKKKTGAALALENVESAVSDANSKAK